jgi:hypothetical protein
MYKIIVAALILANSLWASASIGSVAGQFLEVNLHVRNMGMGNAATSLVHGSSAVLINPAGLAEYRPEGGIDSYMSYVKWPADISFGTVGIATDVGNMGRIGMHAVYVNYADEIRTTPDMPFGDGTFSIGGMSLGLSYSRFLTDKFSFGVTIKHVSENYDESGYGQLAWDIGTLYRTSFHNLKIGMSILNFSREAQFDGTYLDYSDPIKYAVNDSSEYGSWPLPMTFRTGLSMDVWQSGSLNAIVSMDMIHSNNNDELYALGTEINYLKKFDIRAGYQIGTDIQGLSFGAGFQLMESLSLDYAFNAMEYFGPRHRFGLKLNF